MATATQTEARQAAQAYLNSRLANGTRTSSANGSKPFIIPAIDISSTFNGSLDDRKKVAAQIRQACTTSGFFHITGHGIPEETRQAVLQLAQRFFKDLTREKKEELHVRNSKYFRGWEPAEYTYVNPSDWSGAAAPETKEGFNWGYEPGLDPHHLSDGNYRELDGGTENGNIWPSETDLPGFYSTIAKYYSSILQLAKHLFCLFALSLDLNEEYFDSMMQHPGGISRLLYYPPVKNPKPLDTSVPHSEEEIGLGAHSDYECFTILLSSSLSGLEILSPEDRWVEATGVEGGFTVNVADFLMRWTNGVYRSTVHRVVNRSETERYSVPFFFSIDYEKVVETLPSCVSEENPSRYPPIKAGEYVLERLKATAKED